MTLFRHPLAQVHRPRAVPAGEGDTQQTLDSAR